MFGRLNNNNNNKIKIIIRNGAKTIINNNQLISPYINLNNGKSLNNSKVKKNA